MGLDADRLGQFDQARVSNTRELVQNECFGIRVLLPRTMHTYPHKGLFTENSEGVSSDLLSLLQLAHLSPRVE